VTQGREWQAWVRRALLVIPGAIVVLALANVFGQHPATTSASAVGASPSSARAVRAGACGWRGCRTGFQTNPTNVGRRTTQTVLYDGPRRLLTITRTLTIFP
jgi:hypothetical protein